MNGGSLSAPTVIGDYNKDGAEAWPLIPLITMHISGSKKREPCGCVEGCRCRAASRMQQSSTTTWWKVSSEISLSHTHRHAHAHTQTHSKQRKMHGFQQYNTCLKCATLKGGGYTVGWVISPFISPKNRRCSFFIMQHLLNNCSFSCKFYLK